MRPENCASDASVPSGRDLASLPGTKSANAFLAVAPLFLLPVIDLTTITLAQRFSSAPSLGSLTRISADILAAIFFWLGTYLLARAAVGPLLISRSGSVRVSAALALSVLIGAMVLYHVLLWAFIAINGHPPSPEILVFLVDNLSRIPQHILQSSPAIAAGAIGVSILMSVVLVQALTAVTQGRVPLGGRRQIAQAVLMFLAWYVIGASGNYRPPLAVLLDGDSATIVDARANNAVHALPDRSQTSVVASPAGSARGPVIVILVESLRYDLLETDPAAIPFIKRMYDEHAGFSRAYATASHSNLSDLAFWYAQYPLRGFDKETFPVDADWRGMSLIDLFKQNGYRTAYVSSQNERWGEMINWLKTPSLDFFFDSEEYQGETWENHDDQAGLAGLIQKGVLQAGKVEDSRTLAVARQWIDSLGDEKTFFLGMNLQNTHFSYVVTPGAAQPYQPSDLGFRAVYYRWPEAKRSNVRNRYLNSVLNVDQLIEGFVAYLEEKGLWDESLFVVLGDNGEAFYEHGFGNHSGPMYDEVVRTLAFMKLPASSRADLRDVDMPVSHIDIAATIPEIVGLPRPWSFQGQPVTEANCRERPVFMYSNAMVRQFGVVEWPWKYLLTEFPQPREELYNLVDDPREQTNVAENHQEELVRLRQSVTFWAALQRRYYETASYHHKAPPAYCS